MRRTLITTGITTGIFLGQVADAFARSSWGFGWNL